MDIPRERPKSRRRYFYIAGGVILVVAVSATLWGLEPASPTVDRATIWTDSVRRGDMVIQVRGPGNLVPERARWIVAETAGRIERIHVEPGASVESPTVLLELSNPDVEIESLNAERQLASAEAELENLRTSLETQRLEQRAAVASAHARYREAERRLESSRELAERNLIPRNELDRIRDEALELRTRLEVEERRLEILSESMGRRLAAQVGQVDRLRAITEFQSRRSLSMAVRAGAEGVVQDLDLEVGQWVLPGQQLARVVEPGRLRAALRIPETQARDLSIGQPALIDTRNGVVEGFVSRIDPSVQSGTVTVEVRLEGDLPRGARPDLSVEGTIRIEQLEDVLHVGRPAYGQAHSTVTLWKVVEGGRAAVRVPVRLGRSSVSTIQILEGLERGDTVILSDLSAYDGSDRVRLK